MPSYRELRPGGRLGSYEIVAPLGAGGMGEVWRARDPRLERDVALKVLPAELAGDAERLAFVVALEGLDSVPHHLADDWRVRTARGLVLAGLGRREEALREARWIEQQAVYRDDAVLGTVLARDRARIFAQLGEAEAALDELERLLAGPAWPTVHTLRLDPRWDPIRDHPRFQELLVRYAPETRSRYRRAPACHTALRMVCFSI